MDVTCFTLTGERCAASLRVGGDTFEIHVTTTPLAPTRLGEYRAACRELGVKAIVIELGPGLPTQPMTCLRVPGSFEEALEEARRLSRKLAERGFSTERIKIEAAPWNLGVPVTDADAANEPPGRYFEHHARLLLTPEADRSALLALCAQEGAHLSRNPFKTREDGAGEWFVTLRLSGVGREHAEARAAGLGERLSARGWPPLSTLLEYCVHDDRRELDAGWERA